MSYKVYDGDFTEGKVEFLEEFLSENYEHEAEDGEFVELAVNLSDGVASWRGNDPLLLYIEEHYKDGTIFQEIDITKEEYQRIREAFNNETGCIFLEYEETQHIV